MRDSDAVAEQASTRAGVSTDEFKMALGRFASGVTVLTARGTGTGDPFGDEDVAMTATAFMAVSLDPPLVAVSVGQEARMFELLTRQDAWAASVLGDGQVHVSSRFAIPGRVSDRLLFEDLPRHRGPVTGAVILDGALSAVECRTVNRIPAGDHTLMVGLVLAVEDLSARSRPLLHFRGQYRAIRDRPDQQV